jgi:hypothetical protein
MGGCSASSVAPGSRGGGDPSNRGGGGHDGTSRPGAQPAAPSSSAPSVAGMVEPPRAPSSSTPSSAADRGATAGRGAVACMGAVVVEAVVGPGDAGAGDGTILDLGLVGEFARKETDREMRSRADGKAGMVRVVWSVHLEKKLRKHYKNCKTQIWSL